MPCLRGIEVSLTTKPDNEQIPEYPHPEGASARLIAHMHPAKAPSPRATDPSGSPPSPAVHRKEGPTTSVYIPSISGTQFAINYTVNSVPSGPCKFVFFRLYINARPIAAWGIDPNVRPSGKVVKSLWAPCGQYNHQLGFEGRNFVFLPGQERKSVAEDGGLIEIQVFRAKERRARAPTLEEFRFRENYGIAAPSIGLLDRPQDACFYDWHLIDAKDSPFASFRLHYRAWKNLKQLNLIPATELERLHSVSPKALRRLVQREIESDFGTKGGDLNGWVAHSKGSDEAVFESSMEEPDADLSRNAPFYFLNSPPELFPTSSSRFRVPQPSKAMRDGHRETYLQRPLPERPLPELPTGPPPGLSRQSSVGSTRSATPSITPSLLHDLGEDSLGPEDIEVGVAQLIHLPPSESSLSLVSNHEPQPMPAAEFSFSDYDNSPQSSNDSLSNSNKMLSPGRYLPTTGSGLEHGLALFNSPEHGVSGSSRSLPSAFYSEQDLALLQNITLTGPEWVDCSPAPARTRKRDDAALRSSSSSPGKVGRRSFFSGFRRRRLSGSPRKLAEMVLGREMTTEQAGGGVAGAGNTL